MSIRPMLAAAWPGARGEGPPIAVLDTPPPDATPFSPPGDAAPVDDLIASVADRLRDAPRPMADEEVRALAEEIVLGAVRVVLGWVEGPAGHRAGP